MIRNARETDLRLMVALDEEVYGPYGAWEFLSSRFAGDSEEVLVEVKGRELVGFSILELYEGAETAKGFSQQRVSPALTGKWAWLFAFTTKGRYRDRVADGKLLKATEERARERGCAAICVPLPKDHPFAKNGVFGFFEESGYKRVGEIVWDGTKPCWFYRKALEA